LDQRPRITLFTISLASVGGLDLELSPEIAAAVGPAAEEVASFLRSEASDK
jgi:hypothetical protein